MTDLCSSCEAGTHGCSLGGLCGCAECHPARPAAPQGPQGTQEAPRRPSGPSAAQVEARRRLASRNGVAGEVLALFLDLRGPSKVSPVADDDLSPPNPVTVQRSGPGIEMTFRSEAEADRFAAWVRERMGV